MDMKELKLACKELANESFQWTKLVKEAKARGETISDEELQNLTAKGAWKKYLMAGGSRTMINDQLKREHDFGGQYKKMCIKAGYLIEDIHGKEIKEGHQVRTKWGGGGLIISKNKKLHIAFESGDYVVPLTKDDVLHRGLEIYNWEIPIKIKNPEAFK